MSACGEFAEHVWKPGSCKNCFHPRNAHGSGDNAANVRTSTASAEDDGLTFSSYYCKPTIAVRPTMMNPENSDIWMDVNMNAEPDIPKNLPDRISLTKLMGISSFSTDSNGCSTVLKEAVIVSAALAKTDSPARFPPGALSPTDMQKESVSNIFGGRGLNSVGQNSTGDAYPHRITGKSKITSLRNGSRQPRDSAQRLQVRSNSDAYNDNISEGPSTQEQNGPLDPANSVISHAPNKAEHEPSSTSAFSSFTPDSALPISRPCGRSSSFLSEPTSLSDSGSYRSSTDSLTCSQGLDVFRRSASESRQSLASPDSSWSEKGNGSASAEPIYAESTKRKRAPLGDRQTQQSPVEVTGEAQRAKITVMAHTEESNCTFYLSSPDSAVSTEWPHFSPNSIKLPSSLSFKWPSSWGSTQPAVVSTQAKRQASPPVPPKRISNSPKLGTSSLGSLLPSEVQSCVNVNATSSTATLEKLQENAVSSSPTMVCSERRHKLYNTHWNWKTCIEEEEEGGEGTVHQSIINEAAVSQKGAWSPMVPVGEILLPGTADNGASQQHQGSAVETDSQRRKMLSQATSATTDLPAGLSENHDPSPPPPPPKKHHRSSSKMSQSSFDSERASRQGSMESLTQSLRALSGSLASASSDSLHCDSKVFPDGGYQDSSNSPLTSSPVSLHPEAFPGLVLDQIQPPPLPEKKLLSRAVSAPGGPSGKPIPRGRPRFPFGGSETNVAHPERAQSSQPSSPVDPRHQYSSSESLECYPSVLNRSQTLDEPPTRGRSRFGGYLRGGVTSSSSPQLSHPHHSHSAGSSLHLQTLLSNIDSREGIYSKLGGLYAESLRRLALKCEEHFTRSQRNPLHFDESNWSLFKLTCNKPCCDAGDAVYYSASCASDPKNSYAVKICKSQTSDSKQGDIYGLSVQKSMPPHFNLQQDCGHFIACVPQSMLLQDAEPRSPGPGGQERVVVITREVPRQTAADFVRGWVDFHRAQPETYERRVCFLLLQLCNGLEHLKEHGVSHRDLCLENLLLVPGRSVEPGAEQTHLSRLLISNFAKSKQRNAEDASAADPRLRKDHARLAPEIVSASQYRKFDEFQTGILIYELLHQPNPFEMNPELKHQDYRCEELPPIPPVSIYSPGLQRLAHLLLQPDPIKRIPIQEAKRVLQCLLWGPRRDLMEQQWDRPGGLARHDGLLNWLDVKRALLMMKFAERSLEPERTAELEDWLCCQYFSSAHPLSLCHTAGQLYSRK
ncbi:inactive tyrosine-protein kinase PRAG1 isoform X1 [Brienomyrus brachyistius]|uniref:inactive tyrosine-protein kinase PRAG1 isoform X1 n=1 Tax=Brienomyrus brachyistius TaxID=42636 RepID=UPI0020B3F2D1|nr:inactive tyrosine-protein kinase PRAG1 isoform X1 [Brienomyrus brachyistius]XP_048876431.1 inactive tyrosine-protein kinase PRAG1 isoform X1 [Brienomyrus brachyistius]XP_048876432.1 inactive tyrosine-protein kinase PRAG1 isoform X1 [Brienomyrus brachyistius]XP_048876433.1 inactive tyrosine-protein kinase PRAG1 isoform X1 [Brienomyrus brachyistius]XP_048876435.1 inactive tyrosine-protein kinase PRAG1 isoform X1 [Brienomyrus brachyistius]XP_048876436.1 inactive tyrosine-protein kinase PRAG1 i